MRRFYAVYSCCCCKSLCLLAVFIGFHSSLFAQPQAQILEYQAFRNTVLAFHPSVRQADLLPIAAKWANLSAKGGFDPKTFATGDVKNFNGKSYFQYFEGGVKLPTLWGLELKSSYNQARGTFLNPESALPRNGQAALGLKWSLGQGLMLDARRAQLSISQIGISQAQAERNLVFNNLMLEAGAAFWSWATSANQIQVIQEAQQQAQIRHQALTSSFINGERSAVDTLESFILLQTRALELGFANVELQNANVELTNYFWNANATPRDISDFNAVQFDIAASAFPIIDTTQKVELQQLAANTHPELLIYTQKASQLGIEKRLKNEKRKPVFDVEYYLLGNGWDFIDLPNANNPPFVLANNVKVGLNFQYPIPNRTASGEYQMAKLKIEQNELLLQQKRLAIAVKIDQYTNAANTLATQVQLYRQITQNYRTLLDAEQLRFQQGESSVFLLITREQRWLDAQIKYIELVGKYRKAEVGLLWATGRW